MSDQDLVFAFAYNFMKSSAGSSNRTLQLLRFLQRRGLRVTVYSKNYRAGSKRGKNNWRAIDEVLFAQQFPEFELRIEAWSVLDEPLRALKNLLLTCLPKYAKQILKLSVPGIAPKWNLIKAAKLRFMIVGYAHTVTYLNGLHTENWIIDQHDVEFIMNRRVWKRPAHDMLVLLRARRELAILEAAAMILSISYAEWLISRSLLDSPKVVLFPYLQYFGDGSIIRKPLPCEVSYDLLFVGAKGHFNISGLYKFLTDFLGAGANYKIAIAGSVGDADTIRDLANRTGGISNLGYVENLHELYSKSRASICPTGGGGTKTKIIESLQYTKPVFATLEACEGLVPGYEKCVFPLDQEAVRRFLDSSGDRSADCEQYLNVHNKYLLSNAFVDWLDRAGSASAGEQLR